MTLKGAVLSLVTQRKAVGSRGNKRSPSQDRKAELRASWWEVADPMYIGLQQPTLVLPTYPFQLGSFQTGGPQVESHLLELAYPIVEGRWVPMERCGEPSGLCTLFFRGPWSRWKETTTVAKVPEAQEAS